jgi:hypothetical protein
MGDPKSNHSASKSAGDNVPALEGWAQIIASKGSGVFSLKLWLSIDKTECLLFTPQV